METRVYDAPVAADTPIPAYKIMEVDGPFSREIVKFDPIEKKMERAKVVHPRGYMVLFPRGHSIFYHTLEELERNGYSEVVPLIRAGAQESEMVDEHQLGSTKIPIAQAKSDEE